jgi:beta-phosphoglucomutase
MEQHLKAWQHAFSRFKVQIKAEEFYLLEGRGVKAVVETLTEKYGINKKHRQDIMDVKIKYYNTHFHPEFYDGLFSLLNMIKDKKSKMAVVTGGMRGRTNNIIDMYMAGYFSAIITSDDVNKTKPYPEPYLKAASSLNTKTEDCLVIENAPMGVKAAKAAGMDVVAITTTLPAKYFFQADYITNNFHEIKNLLTKTFLLDSE